MSPEEMVQIATYIENKRQRLKRLEDSILEDIQFLSKKPRWRVILALPDIWWAAWRYRRGIASLNRDVSIFQAIMASHQQRLHEHLNRQMNVNFEDEVY